MKQHPSKMRSLGFTIDTSCYPWLAYTGERFRPKAMHWCYTDEESRLMGELKVSEHGEYPLTESDARRVVIAIEFQNSEGQSEDSDLNLRRRLREYFNMGDGHIQHPDYDDANTAPTSDIV